jgi:hypothetical protein
VLSTTVSLFPVEQMHVSDASSGAAKRDIGHVIDLIELHQIFHLWAFSMPSTSTGRWILGFISGLMGHGSEVDPAKLNQQLEGVLLDGERVQHAFKVIRDTFIFTDRRLILIDVQGMTGSKMDYLTIPYRAITRFSVETSGSFDLDAELKIWVSGSTSPIGKSLKKGTDVRAIQRCLAAGACR